MMRIRNCAALLLISLAVSAQAAGAPFGAQQVISTAADDAYSVFAADLDGDGDLDVLSASRIDNRIAWYENRGGGSPRLPRRAPPPRRSSREPPRICSRS